MAQDGHGPFGGFKLFGIGRNLGCDGVLAFTEPHAISMSVGFPLGPRKDSVSD
jgi:acyl-CoA reductase-like NAD-dependent aldehyde dehydrogenase